MKNEPSKNESSNTRHKNPKKFPWKEKETPSRNHSSVLVAVRNVSDRKNVVFGEEKGKGPGHAR